MNLPYTTKIMIHSRGHSFYARPLPFKTPPGREFLFFPPPHNCILFFPPPQSAQPPPSAMSMHSGMQMPGSAMDPRLLGMQSAPGMQQGSGMMMQQSPLMMQQSPQMQLSMFGAAPPSAMSIFSGRERGSAFGRGFFPPSSAK